MKPDTLSTTHLLSLLDLTSLNADEDPQKITAFCARARQPQGAVAAVCLYPQWVRLARECLGPEFRIATVSNFPSGMENSATYFSEIESAITDGANEIDWVLPYPRLLEGDFRAVEKAVKNLRSFCPAETTLKIILETGALETAERITIASQIAIEQGADFIKTSTGKVAVGATPEAAEVMLKMIEKYRTSKRVVGFKAAGGVRTLEQALGYIHQASVILGEGFITANTFRLGASQLLDACLSIASAT